jgi:sulfite exporter TauE/SafE
MCGAFGLGVSTNSRTLGELTVRHVAYQLGKACSYAFVGVLLLLATSWVASEFPIFLLQHVITLVVGSAMLLTGVLLVAERRLPPLLVGWWKNSSVCQGLGALWRSPSLYKCTLIGWVNGFLPCGLSLMALLFLSREGDVLETVLGAFVFSAGTLPALLATGWLGQKFSPQQRRRLVRWSGVLLIVFGAITLLRDHPVVHRWFHSLVPDVLGGGGGHHH